MTDIFSPASIAQSVHESMDGALAAIPEGHTGAVLIHAKETASGASAEVVFAQKIGDHWKLAAGAQWVEHQGFSGEVALIGSW